MLLLEAALLLLSVVEESEEEEEEVMISGTNSEEEEAIIPFSFRALFESLSVILRNFLRYCSILNDGIHTFEGLFGVCVTCR